MRVVFDTNVFISAFIVPGSQGERAFLLACRKRVSLCTSVAILTETAQKLREKFAQSESDIKAALKLVSRVAEVLKPTVRVHLLADNPDNRILECALAARADLIVSGDRHLRQLRTFRGIPIVRLADFLRLFPAEPPESG
jgi:putative PIN family toxin of toxin-antitoxin system